jgi:copper chaperone CopZ
VDDVQVGSAKVRYDENKVTEKNIVEAIEEAGYKVIK